MNEQLKCLCAGTTCVTQLLPCCSWAKVPQSFGENRGKPEENTGSE